MANKERRWETEEDEDIETVSYRMKDLTDAIARPVPTRDTNRNEIQ